MKKLNYSYIQHGGKRFDILKFVLAMLIVAMHSGVFPRWLLPLPRLAVPLFFMMTSYFFFLKLKDAVDKNKLLVKYVKRNVQLYLFWSFVLCPCIFLFHLSWFQKGIAWTFHCILKSFFITGFFPASWFILATIYAVVIVYVLSKQLKNVWIFIIALLVYSLALLDSNYGGLLNEGARNYFEHMNIRHSLNLPAALIWVVIGKMLAEKPIKISQSVIWLLLLIASLVYYGEFIMVEHFGWSIHTDCFLTSIPLCTLIFIAIGQSRDIPCRYALWLRKSSIIIYCVHLTLIKLLCLFSAHYIDLPELAIWSITLGLSLVTAFLTVFLCEQKNVKWFKYAY